MAMMQSMPGINLRRNGEGLSYDAPNHFDIGAVRLQGLDAGGPDAFWVGLSHIQPGGRAGPDAGPTDKVYVVLEGDLMLRSDGGEIRIGRMDSVCIKAGTQREIVNATGGVVTMLVIMPRAPAA